MNKKQSTYAMMMGLCLLALCALAAWSAACDQHVPTEPPPASAIARRTTAPVSTRVPPTVARATATRATPSPIVTPGPSSTPTVPPPPPALLTAFVEWGTVEPSPTPPPPPLTLTALAKMGTVIPTPTMTAKEQALVTEMQHDNPQSASSFDGCDAILKTYPWCDVFTYATHITRPEWKALFPDANFSLVEYNLYGRGESGAQNHHVLIAEQWGDRLRFEKDFQLLMGLNHIRVTDENRELVAKAFVLTALSDYLAEDIVFSDWEEGSWPGPVRLRYNYSITAWTEIQGLEIEWVFLFDKEGLLGAEGFVVESNIGDYIDVPFNRLPPPSHENLTYWRQQ